MYKQFPLCIVHMHTHTGGKHYAIMLLLLENRGGVKHGFTGLLSTFYHPHLFTVCLPGSGNKGPETRIIDHVQISRRKYQIKDRQLSGI